MGKLAKAGARSGAVPMPSIIGRLQWRRMEILPLVGEVSAPQCKPQRDHYAFSHEHTDRRSRSLARNIDRQASRAYRDGAGEKQGQEPPATATSISPGDSRRSRHGWETPRSRMLGLQTIPSPLYRATVARIAEAAAGAGCGQPSRLQRLWCQE
jgi:hypothetical protein